MAYKKKKAIEAYAMPLGHCIGEWRWERELKFVQASRPTVQIRVGSHHVSVIANNEYFTTSYLETLLCPSLKQPWPDTTMKDLRGLVQYTPLPIFNWLCWSRWRNLFQPSSRESVTGERMGLEPVVSPFTQAVICWHWCLCKSFHLSLRQRFRAIVERPWICLWSAPSGDQGPPSLIKGIEVLKARNCAKISTELVSSLFVYFGSTSPSRHCPVSADASAWNTTHSLSLPIWRLKWNSPSYSLSFRCLRICRLLWWLPLLQKLAPSSRYVVQWTFA